MPVVCAQSWSLLNGGGAGNQAHSFVWAVAQTSFALQCGDLQFCFAWNCSGTSTEPSVVLNPGELSVLPMH